MRGRWTLFAFTILIAGACSHSQVPVPSLPQVASTDASALVARGESIVRNAAVCGHCHGADPKNADSALSGGREFHDWRVGTARASNLTPDVETGLGAWSDAEIVRALRNGVRKDGRLLAPVMPYEWLHEMSDEDALAVARYLKSLPPVHNEVKQDFNFIFKVGKAFFLRAKPAMSVTAPPRGATAEYGRYFSQHAALCADCHTPRGGIRSMPDRKRLFAGMAKPPKGFPANPSNLTPDNATGIGKWSEEEFIQTIRTGKTPEGETLHPFMPWRENARLSEDELRAIYRFLRTLPPIHNEIPRKPAT
jgi:mono/diheme cytochrome c family protein